MAEGMLRGPGIAAVRADGRRGRGATANPSGRFERLRKLTFNTQFSYDDGWGGADAPPPPLRTMVTTDASRSVITHNDSRDIGFGQSINPYRGCEHRCIYCFARPTHAFLGLSPGLDFESRLFAKPDAALLLALELRRLTYKPSVIALGTNTDPYQPVERRMRITRSVLQVLADFHHPCIIVTKSALVLRDLDIIAPMADKGLAQVALSVTTLDRKLARAMEPRAATPAKRLDAIHHLAKAGVPTSVMAAPMIPGLTDSELEEILDAAAEAGAVGAGYILLRLPLEIAGLFTDWLGEHAPNKAAKVMNLMRSAHGGKAYDAAFGRRQTGRGPFADLLAKRFQLACKRLGLNIYHHRLDTRQFRPPPTAGDQLSFF
jgi:DNA repair photolyase